MPTDHEHVRGWLKALGSLCAGRSTPEEADARVGLYVSMLANEYPQAAFTRPSLAAVGKVCKFWPSYGELCAALTAWWADNRPYTPAPVFVDHEQRRLAAPEPRGPLTDEQKARVAAQVKALKQDVAGMAQPGRKEAIQARPSAPHHLIAGYEKMIAEGSPMAAGARLRLAQLRREHGESA